MKNIFTVLTIACATLLLMQCKKEIVERPNVTPSGETIDVSLNVAEDCSKTGISTTGIVTWNTGDKLYVVGEEDGYLGYISAQNSGASAYFTGTISKPSTTTQDFHFYYTGNQGFTLTDNNTYFTYDVSMQTGSLANIAANLHLMHGIIENVDKNSTNFGSITMTSMMSIVKLQFSVASGTLGNKIMCTGGYSGVKFNVKKGVDKYGNFVSEGRVRYIKDINLNEVASNTYYMVVLPGTQTLEFSQGLIGKSCECPTGGFAVNKIYNEKPVQLDLLPYFPAIFTVNKGTDTEQWTEDDTQVKFSKGNLWYGPKTDGAAATWNLETNQWEYYSSYSSSTWNHISHFFWSNTTDWQTSGMEPYAKTYSSSAQGTSDNFFTEASDFTVEGQNGWYTLSKDEWRYLINNSNMKWSNVTFDNNGTIKKKGMILMPDNWSGTPSLESTTSYNTWQTLSAAGAVFLPAAGIRYETSISNVDSNGCYWSSNPSESKDKAKRMYFNASILSTSDVDRHSGNAVRLVKVVH